MVLTQLAEDKSPVAVFSGTGGAARDIFNYCRPLDPDGRDLETPARQLPVSGSEEYIRGAQELLPQIQRAGSFTGHNGCKLLIFLNLEEAASASINGVEETVGEKLLEAVLNGCRTTREEILLAVAWGDKQVLRALLEREANWPDDGTVLRQATDSYLSQNTDKSRVQSGQAALALSNALVTQGATIEQQRGMLEATDAFLSAPSAQSQAAMLSHFVAPTPHDGLPSEASRGLVKQMKGWALEAALHRRDEELVTCLLEYGAEAPCVSPLELWKETRVLVRYDAEIMQAEEGGMWHAGDWTGVLSELVDGYDYNINVRAMLAGSPDAIKPTWTDLMMWSVLVGEPGLAHRLWGRSRMPLRAALMASQFCKLMADEPAASRSLLQNLKWAWWLMSL